VGEALRFNFFDSAFALNMAFFVNAGILILAAATFYKAGMFNVSEIQDAYKFLEPMLGTHWASILFAVALIAAGQSSTLTGTLAGQIVMEGFINFRIQPWARRMITRALAIIPAVLVLVYYGENYTGKLLVLSQVVLSLQLGFATIPLIHFVSEKKSMGQFAIKLPVKILSWLVAGIIVVLNLKLVVGELNTWITTSSSPWIIWVLVIPVVIFLLLVLLYLTVLPIIKQAKEREMESIHTAISIRPDLNKPIYERVVVALDFSKADSGVVQHALATAGKNAEYLFVHIVESAAALVFGDETDDLETGSDEKRLQEYTENLIKEGYHIETKIGNGPPKVLIPQLTAEFRAQLLVMGAHGHGWFRDFLFGTTIETVRHKVKIPVLIVRNKEM
jgi:manganese transport protein